MTECSLQFYTSLVKGIIMCFRPAETNESIQCPNCGKGVNYTQGLLPKKCPFCKTELSELSQGQSVAPQAPQAPAAPGAPKPPSIQ